MPQKLERCVAKVLKQKIAKFVKDNGQQPTKSQKSKMRQSAYAICTVSTSCLGTLTGELKYNN